MRNQGTILAVAISLLVLGLVFIFVVSVYLPNEKKRMTAEVENTYKKVGVLMVKSGQGLSKGTVIDEDIFKYGSIEIEEIPIAFIPDGGSGSLIISRVLEKESDREILKSQILGRVLNADLISGTMIPTSCLTDEAVNDINHSLRQIEIEASNEAGEALKMGKYVDVLVNYKIGDYDILLSKKRIEKLSAAVTSEDGSQEQSAEAAPADGEEGSSNLAKVKILISVNEEEYRDITYAKNMGSFSLRVYKSEKQYPTITTYDYEMNIKIIQRLIQKFKDEQAKKAEKDGGGGSEDKLDMKNIFEEASYEMRGIKSNVSSNSEEKVELEKFSDYYLRYFDEALKGKNIVYKKESDVQLTNAIIKYCKEERKMDMKPEEMLKLPLVYEERVKVINLIPDGVLSLDEVAYLADVSRTDAFIMLVMGNKAISGPKGENRIQLFTSLINETYSTKIGIRKAVAKRIVSLALGFYTHKDVDSIAYLIEHDMFDSQVKANLMPVF